MVYAYAVTEPPSDPTCAGDLPDPSLRVVRTGELAAVVGDRADAELEVTERALWEHERIVEALLDGGAVLPMRFGSVLPDDDAVEAMLTARRSELLEGLRRVRGAVELGVRSAWIAGPGEDGPSAGAAPQQASPGPGKAYLQRLEERRRRARELAQRLDAALAGLFRAQVHRLLPSSSVPLKSAYLVEREAVEAFRARVDALDETLECAGIVCSGPWPPYSFTGGAGA